MGEDEYRQPVAAAAHFFRLTSIRRNPSLTLVRSGNADARFRGLVGVPTYQQGLSNPSCSSCRREGGARSCRKGPGHPPDASILFFFKPDGFRETCLSFHVASLLLIWALKLCDRASLVAQWLRICLLMQGTRVRALVWEDPTCHGAAGPVSHNC